MKGKNILIVWPEFAETYWSFKKALRYIRKLSSLPPIGALTVGAMLEKEGCKNIRLADLNVRPLGEEEIKWADYVLISSMAVQRKSVDEVIALCKKVGTKIIAGGPLFTSDHESFLGVVDHMVLNEAEITLPMFLADLEKGNPQPVYTSTEFADMTESPVPLWNLVNWKHYASAGVQISRGCPHLCDFCDVTKLFGRAPRVKTITQVIAELDAIVSSGYKGAIFIVDDNFIGPNNKFLKEEMLPALITWQESVGHSMPFYTQSTIKLARDPELMELMFNAGIIMIFTGIETPEEDTLKACRKTQNTKRDLIADINTIQRAGIQVQSGFILGFDTDDPETIFDNMTDFIMQSGIVTAMVGLLNAPFMTELWERLKRENRILGKMTGDNVDGSTNIIPIMDIKVLRAGYQRVVSQIYSPKNYYRRIRTFLTEYKTPKVRPKFDWQHFLAFFRAWWHLGIADKGLFYYWHLLIWTIIRKPKLFPLAVHLAITGDHFRSIVRRINKNIATT
ncbi:MAG: B12-binding domain-containing radical SAM protein [Candidatus Scalindua sp.]|nr:B12-binding domain-containing radical SAM protein [Candidatus Scalindua sp.]